MAWSSAKEKIRAKAQGNCELLWMKIILDNLKKKCEGPMKMT